MSYKEDLLNNLIESGALKISKDKDDLFAFKSGRMSTNFINTGSMIQGKSTSIMKIAIADFIKEELDSGALPDFDFIFGPAYKGINLACLACEGLYERHKINKQFLYDRKEAKTYADVKCDKIIVGAGFFKPGQKILIIDDVITTGGTKVEAIDKLKLLGDHKIVGLVLVADRQEKLGDAKKVEDLSASENLAKNLEIPVFAILTMEEIFAMVKDDIPTDVKDSWIEYFDKYGAVKLK